MAPTTTRPAAPSAPPVTDTTSMRVTRSGGAGRGIETGAGEGIGAAGWPAAGSTAVTAASGSTIPAPVLPAPAPVPPSAVATMRLTTSAAVSFW